MGFTSYQIEMLQRAMKTLPIDAGEVNDWEMINNKLSVMREESKEEQTNDL
jgi:hypothetical protein